jgi:hypothetical protein
MSEDRKSAKQIVSYMLSMIVSICEWKY